jgi:hypothetical protein
MSGRSELQKEISLVALALCILPLSIHGSSWNASAIAQSASAGMCLASELSLAQLKSLESPDVSVQTAAGRAIVDNWRVSIPVLIRALGQIQTTAPSSWPEAERQRAIVLTDVVRTTLATSDQTIYLFRRCRDDKAIRALIAAARGDDTTLRINATSILADVVDNTTLCLIFPNLRDKTISTNGLTNLLGVTASVAGYAYKENYQQLSATITDIQRNIDNSKSDSGQIQKVITEIAARAQRSSNKDRPLTSAGLNSLCE